MAHTELRDLSYLLEDELKVTSTNKAKVHGMVDLHKMKCLCLSLLELWHCSVFVEGQ